jgi:hypothetical protein
METPRPSSGATGGRLEVFLHGSRLVQDLLREPMAKNIDRVMRIIDAAAALIQVEAACKPGRVVAGLKPRSAS